MDDVAKQQMEHVRDMARSSVKRLISWKRRFVWEYRELIELYYIMGGILVLTFLIYGLVAWFSGGSQVHME